MFSGHLPSFPSVQTVAKENCPRPHLGKGAIFATFWDKHSFLRLLGLLQGLSPLQATLALASI
jgi:hypothetical protein